MAAGHFGSSVFPYLEGNGIHHPSEETLLRVREGHTWEKTPRPIFYDAFKLHVKAQHLPFTSVRNYLVCEFDWSESKASKVVSLVSGGRIFVPCIRRDRVKSKFDYLSPTVGIFEFCRVNRGILMGWANHLPDSSGKDYERPVELIDVLERLDPDVVVQL